MATTETQKFACAQCGGSVEFKEGTHALLCAHCGFENVIARDPQQQIVEHDFSAGLQASAMVRPSEMMQGAHEMRCGQCGAQIVTAQISSRCAYCDAPAVVDISNDTPMIRPESLLPFGVPRQDALGHYRTWLSSRWFAPNDLEKRAKEDRIDGVYLPYWTYDSHATTRYRGERGDHYWETEFYTDTESYTDSNGQMQTRSVQKTRQVQKTRWSSASGTVQDVFDDVLVCASEALPRELIEKLEPWDLGALVPYAPQYLIGFFAERYKLDLQQGFGRAQERMEQVIRQTVCRDIGGDVQRISSLDTQHASVRFKHLLLPLWISAFRYNDKVFRFCVNGRTGEVQGERPYSIIKITLAVLAVLMLIVMVIWFVQMQSHVNAHVGAWSR